MYNLRTYLKLKKFKRLTHNFLSNLKDQNRKHIIWVYMCARRYLSKLKGVYHMGRKSTRLILLGVN